MILSSICQILGYNFTVWKSGCVFQAWSEVFEVQIFQPVTYWNGKEHFTIACSGLFLFEQQIQMASCDTLLFGD